MTTTSSSPLPPGRVSAGKPGDRASVLRLREQAACAIATVVPAGEPVAAVVTNTPAGLALLGALLDSGLPAVLLPGSLRPGEVDEALASAAIRYVAAPLSLSRDLPFAGRRVVWEGSGVRLFERAVHGPQSPIADLPVLCQLTSGSTGPSRFAVRPLDGVLAEADVVADALGLTESDRVLCASSIAHSYALVGGLVAASRCGARVFLAPAPADAAALIREVRPTVIFGLPGTYRALLAERDAIDGQGLRWALSAGAPLPEGLHGACLEATGIPIRQDYGTTETGTITLDTAEEADPGSVGRVLPHIEVRVEPPGAGEVLVRSAVVASHYVESGELVSALDAEGWYRTGDLGSLATDGRLQLDGRVRAPILVDGVSVQLEAVEGVLLRHAGVREAVVVPSRAGGHRKGLKAVVVAPGCSDVDLRAWYARQAPEAPIPVAIEVRESLPYSPAGKLLRKYL